MYRSNQNHRTTKKRLSLRHGNLSETRATRRVASKKMICHHYTCVYIQMHSLRWRDAIYLLSNLSLSHHQSDSLYLTSLWYLWVRLWPRHAHLILSCRVTSSQSHVLPQQLYNVLVAHSDCHMNCVPKSSTPLVWPSCFILLLYICGWYSVLCILPVSPLLLDCPLHDV